MSCSALKKLSSLQEELSLHDISIGENESKNILQELQKANTNFYLAHDVILKAKGSELGITPHQKGLVNKFIKAVANGQEPTQKQYDAIDMIRDLRELITKEDSKKKDPKPKVKENSKELLGTYMYTDTNGEIQIKDGKAMIKITPEVTLFDVLNTTQKELMFTNEDLTELKDLESYIRSLSRIDGVIVTISSVNGPKSVVNVTTLINDKGNPVFNIAINRHFYEDSGFSGFGPNFVTNLKKDMLKDYVIQINKTFSGYDHRAGIEILSQLEGSEQVRSVIDIREKTVIDLFTEVLIADARQNPKDKIFLDGLDSISYNGSETVSALDKLRESTRLPDDSNLAITAKEAVKLAKTITRLDEKTLSQDEALQIARDVAKSQAESLNEEQLAMFNTLIDSVLDIELNKEKDPVKRTIAVDAAGGTGKTYTISKFLNAIKEMKSKKVFDALGVTAPMPLLLAPTNKALSVLEEDINSNASQEEYVPALTVASALGLVKDSKTGNFVQKGLLKLTPNTLLIVDEASMLTESTLEMMYKILGLGVKDKTIIARTIFLGDSVQAPPIRSGYDKKLFKDIHGRLPVGMDIPSAFTEKYVSKTLSLKKVMRFDEKSKIGEITTNIREAVLAKQSIDPTTFMDGEDSSIGKGSVKYLETVEAVANDFVKTYKEDDSTVIVTFNNHVNKHPESVGSLNKLIRSKLEPKHMNDVIVGDRVAVYTGYEKKVTEEVGLQDEERHGIQTGYELAVLVNSSTYKVTKASEPMLDSNVKVQVRWKPTAGYITLPPIEYQIVELQDENGNQKMTRRTVDATLEVGRYKLLTPKGRATIEAFAKAQQTPFKYYRVLDVLSKVYVDSQLAYAITAHKSQGSSYNNVTVMVDNMTSNVYSDMEEKTKLLYVAVSRPKKNLTLHTKQRTKLRAGVGIMPKSVARKGSSSDVELRDTTELQTVTANLSTDLGNIFNSFVNDDLTSGKLVTTQNHIGFMSKVFANITDFFAENLPQMTIELTLGNSANGTKGAYTETSSSLLSTDDKISVFEDSSDRTISKTEVFLHELLHKLAKNISKVKPALFKNLKRVREALIEDYGEQREMFLYALQEANATPNERRIALDRFDYVMTKNADIEEFYAFVGSNPLMYELVSNIDLDAIAEAKRDDSLSSMLSALISEFFKSMFNRKSHGIEIFLDTMENIEKYQKKVILAQRASKLGETVPLLSEKSLQLLDAVNLRIVGDIFNVSYDTVYQVTSKLREFGIPVNSKLRKGIEYLIRQGTELSEKTGNMSKSEAFKLMAELPIIKQIVQTEVIQSIGRSLFTDTANGRYKDYYTQFRKGIALINKLVLDNKNSLKHIVNDMELNNKENAGLNQRITRHLVTTGLIRFTDLIESINSEEELDTLLVQAEQDAFKTVGSSTLSMAHLKALAKHSIDGGVHIHNQQINTENIMRFLHTSSVATDKRKNLRVPKEVNNYVALLIMKEVGFDKVKDTIPSKDTQPKLYEELKELSTIVTNRHNKNVFMMKDSRFTSIPFNYHSLDSDQSSLRIQLMPVNDMITDERMGMTVIDKNKVYTIRGKEYIKIVRDSPDVAYSEGMLKFDNIQPKGISLRNEIIKSLNEQYQGTKSQSDIMTQANAIIKAMHKDPKAVEGIIELTDEYLPVYDYRGNLRDYVLPITKEENVVHLDKDYSLLSAIPSTVTKFIAMEYATLNNNKVIDMIMSDIIEDNDRRHGLGKDFEDDYQEDFVFVGEKSKNPEYAKAWDMFPTHLKRYISLTTGDNGIKIPKSIVNQVLGFKEASVSNISLINKLSPDTQHQVKEISKYSETVIKEVLGYFKGLLVKLTPDIVINNTISNMSIAWGYGITPTEYISTSMDYKEMLDDYELTNATLIELKVSKQLGKKNLDGKIKVLEQKLRNSPAYTLVQDGQFSPLINDLTGTMSSAILGGKYDKLKAKNTSEEATKERLLYKKALVAHVKDKSKTIDEHYTVLKNRNEDGKVPEEMFTAIENLFVLKGSKAEEVATKVTMYSDTITRLMIYDKEVARITKEKGEFTNKDRQKLLNSLDMLLVNYGYLDNKYQSWMDKVGGLFFLKYLFKSQKGYQEAIKRNPLAIAIQQIGQEMADMDIADPLDTVLNHDMITNVINREQLDTPLHILSTVATPSVFMPITEL